MNLTDERYSQYALVREMMDTVDVVKKFDINQTKNIAEKIRSVGKLLLTGEGSSRIFPAKNAIRKTLTWGLDLNITTEGSRPVRSVRSFKLFSVLCIKLRTNKRSYTDCQETCRDWK